MRRIAEKAAQMARYKKSRAVNPNPKRKRKLKSKRKRKLKPKRKLKKIQKPWK